MSGASRSLYRPFAGLILCIVAASALAQTSSTFTDAFDAMKADRRLQFELPAPEVAPERANSDWLLSFMKILGPILEVLFYIFIGCLVAVILYYLLREIVGIKFTRHKREEKTEDEAVPLYTPSDNEARILLDDIDALAAQGKFAEAVHTLLFRSIQDIDMSRPGTIRRSLTSREIAALDILTPKSQTAFSTIAKVVENNFFGGRDLGRIEFDKCRAAYAALTAKVAAA